MSIDEQHVALPKLYGAPAYARPPARVSAAPRPFDPDELPLEAHREGDEEQQPVTMVASSSDATEAGKPRAHRGGVRRLRLPAMHQIAGRLGLRD